MKKALYLGLSSFLALSYSTFAEAQTDDFLTESSDDPENFYSGAPVLDWDFFDNRMRIILKNVGRMHQHRDLGIDYASYYYEEDAFTYVPNSGTDISLSGEPVVPMVVAGYLGKLQHNGGAHPKIHTMEDIQEYMSHYPNLIFGGGAAAEIDHAPVWKYDEYYGKVPVGKSGRKFPSIWFDNLESYLRLAPLPYLTVEHNDQWASVYSGAEQTVWLNCQQMFYRTSGSVAGKMTALRSACREYPEPFRIQWSGVVSVDMTNLDEVKNAAEDPEYELVLSNSNPNYGKSYALCRQMLYYAWLQGANLFNYESGDFVRNDRSFPAPISLFQKKADDFIGSFGQPGPVDTRVAIISEFQNAWNPPAAENAASRNKPKVIFEIIGEEPYTVGDHQLHGLRNFIMPGYIQSEHVYMKSMMESYALPPTPYGDGADYLMSNVRDEALSRYDLLIWGGIPPESPSVVREKLLRHIDERNGRVILFASAARRMFPELFSNNASVRIPAESLITYGDSSFTERSDWTLYELASTSDMEVLATVSGQPLIVDKDGLVIVLSDYGMNRSAYTNTRQVRYTPDRLITNVPYKLLTHVNHLLDTEISACTPFTVGNENLHFIVTRPQEDEYLIGLFNDKMNSEPFSISSHIGEVLSLEEISLDDDKEALKAAANGAPYAPPGLRSPSDLPIDYGLSDAENIEGRDFRLFRVRVEETMPRPMPSIQYQDRPHQRVLAVRGLEYIRKYIQNIPSFFQWFDGVKVDADALASMDDFKMSEEAFYLNRRAVRIVLNGVGFSDTTILAAISKLALIEGNRKQIVIASPSSDVQLAADAADVAIVSPISVNRSNGIGKLFEPSATLNILDLYYDFGDEDSIFRDLLHFRNGEAITNLQGKFNPSELDAPLNISDGASNKFLHTGPYLYSLADYLLQNRSSLSEFGGIVIDSTYLRSKSVEQIMSDKAALDQEGLDLIVDLRSDQSIFDGIAWFTHLPSYQDGINKYTDIINKMSLIGSSHLIVALMPDTQTVIGGVGQREAALTLFESQAAAKNINLHLVIAESNQKTAITKSPNVFVIKGNGTKSPLSLIAGGLALDGTLPSPENNVSVNILFDFENAANRWSGTVDTGGLVVSDLVFYDSNNHTIPNSPALWGERSDSTGSVQLAIAPSQTGLRREATTPTNEKSRLEFTLTPEPGGQLDLSRINVSFEPTTYTDLEEPYRTRWGLFAETSPGDWERILYVEFLTHNGSTGGTGTVLHQTETSNPIDGYSLDPAETDVSMHTFSEQSINLGVLAQDQAMKFCLTFGDENDSSEDVFISLDNISIQNVLVSVPAGYNQWADLYGGFELIGSPTNDYDNSGMKNLIEFALGGNPADPSDDAGLL
ncbi:MAG: hypothetical protein AAGH40_13555, partial [Verrucomicrobiota bacterium]